MTDSLPLVVAVIPVFNRRADVLAMLGQLRTQTYRNLKVVVVDDGSSDGTSEAVSAAYPDAVILRGDGNLWWAGATNLGVRWAMDHGSDYVLTLNDDQRIDSEFLSVLVRTSREIPKSIVGSIVYRLSAPETVYSGGIKLSRYLRRSRLLKESDDYVNTQAPFEIDILPGYSVLIPIQVFRDVGLFDFEHMPQVYMEGEFCLRAKRAGYRVFTDPRSKVWNDVANKEGTPFWSAVGWRKLKWLASSPKSHLSFGQYFFHYRALFGSWLRFLTFGLHYIVSYPLQLIAFSLTSGPMRRRVQGWFGSSGNLGGPRSTGGARG